MRLLGYRIYRTFMTSAGPCITGYSGTAGYVRLSEGGRRLENLSWRPGFPGLASPDAGHHLSDLESPR